MLARGRRATPAVSVLLRRRRAAKWRTPDRAAATTAEAAAGIGIVRRQALRRSAATLTDSAADRHLRVRNWICISRSFARLLTEVEVIAPRAMEVLAARRATEVHMQRLATAAEGAPRAVEAVASAVAVAEVDTSAAVVVGMLEAAVEEVTPQEAGAATAEGTARQVVLAR